MSEDADVPAISLITTRKGRLSALRQSLPRMAAQPQAEVIVVDYDCPEGSGAWATGEYPAVRVVRVKDAPVFHVARARNLGGQAARGEWLCFVDADTLLDERFAEQVLPLLREGAFYLMDSAQPDAFGTVICLRDDYLALGGYDEVLQGYGTEDRDFYIRLALLGRRRQMLPGEWVTAITHAGDERVRYYEIKDRWLNQRINATYVQIKHDLTRQLGNLNLPLDTRRTVYSEVRRALQRGVETGQVGARVEITLPANLAVRLYGWQMKRVWTYLIEPMPQQPAPGPGIVAGGIPGWRAGVANEKGTIPG